MFADRKNVSNDASGDIGVTRTATKINCCTNRTSNSQHVFVRFLSPLIRLIIVT